MVVIFTGLLGAISLPLVIFSAVPLMEIFFFSFILMSLTFYLLWKEKKLWIYYWLSICAASVGNTARYESWLFSFFLFVVITYDLFQYDKTKIRFTLTISSILLLSSFPIYWLYISQISTGSTGKFVSSVINRYNPSTFFDEVKDNVLYTFFSINIISLNILGMIPLLFLIKKNEKVKSFNFIFWGSLLFFAVVSFVMNINPSHNQWRIAMIWSLLLIPFTGYFLFYLFNKANESNIYKSLFVVFILLIVYAFLLQINKYSSLSYITQEDLKVGKFTRSLVATDSQSKIYIVRSTTDKWKYLNILVSSQTPDNFITTLDNSESLVSDTLQLDSASISKMEMKEVDYLLLPSYIRVVSKGNIISKLMHNNSWTLYKLHETSSK